MAVFVAQQEVGLQAVFDHVRRAPLAGEHGVETEMPPEVVMEYLRAAIHLPLAQHVERFAVEHEDAAGTVAVGRAERADVEAFRAAMHRVRARVVRAGEHFLRLDHLGNRRHSRVRLGVDDVNARGAQPGHDQITALDMRMR